MGLLGTALLVPWSAMVSLQIARMEEGRRVPLWAIFSFGAGCVNAVAFILPFIFWAGAFYRADRSPELVQLINDITWLEFLLFFPTFSMQLFCLAMAGFTQRQGPQVFPRWFLYLNLWMATDRWDRHPLHLLLLRSVRVERRHRVLPSGRLLRPVPHRHFVQFYRTIGAEKHCYRAGLAPSTNRSARRRVSAWVSRAGPSSLPKFRRSRSCTNSAPSARTAAAVSIPASQPAIVACSTECSTPGSARMRGERGAGRGAQRLVDVAAVAGGERRADRRDADRRAELARRVVEG